MLMARAHLLPSIGSVSALALADFTTSNLHAIEACAPDAGAIRTESDAPGLHVAEHVTGTTQEYDTVTGRIRFIPFEFIVRDFDLRSDITGRPPARLFGP